jgi:ABC-type nitrate/sulfonate/bicarbonate transport system substrate-binding protein
MKYCYSFIAAPSVTKPADIKGKTVISDKPNSICSVSFVEWAKRNGLAVEDFDLTYAGSSPNRLAALSSGAAVVVAALTQPLDLLAISRGYRRLFDLATDTTFAFSNFSATKAFVASNPETIAAWIRATGRGTADFYNPRDTDIAVNVLVADSKVEPALARRTIEYLRSIRAFSSSLGVPDAYVQNTAAFMVRTGSMKPPIAIPNYVDRRFCPNSS